MQSSKWRFGNDRPIESYLPEDIAKLLEYKDDEKPSSNCQVDSFPLTSSLETNETRAQENLEFLPKTPISRTPSTDRTHLRERSMEQPFWMCGYKEPRDSFQTSVVNSYPVTAAKEEVAEVPPSMLKFVLPSGPRLFGEGIEEEIQGILDTVVINENALLVQMTLLVAGFIIGPSGESIRSIISKSDATIYSHTECTPGKECRVFYLKGTSQQIFHAMEIITEAVKRYKLLAEGSLSGFQVDRKQHIKGVNFYYYPPPRSAVPYAAGLRVSKNARNKAQNQF